MPSKINKRSEKADEIEKELKLKVFSLEKLVEEKSADLMAKNRELEIEASLERVRSASMAMRTSKELKSVVSVVFKQFSSLSDNYGACLINIFNEDSKDMNLWVGSSGGMEIYPEQITIPYFKHPIFDRFEQARQNKESFFTLSLNRKHKDSFIEIMPAIFEIPKNRMKKMREAEGYNMSAAVSERAAMVIYNYGGVIFSEEDNDLLRRINRVFDQAYTRFLDLQKVEEQAREAQIEAALEKVRSRSLAMHESSELQDVINSVFERLKELKVEMDSANIFIYTKGVKDVECWTAGAKLNRATSYKVPYNDIVVLNDLFYLRENKNELVSKTYSYKDKNEFFNYAIEHTDFKYLSEERKKFILESEVVTVSLAFEKNCWIQLNRFNEKPFLDSENLILKRIAKVFEQAYTRFQDLQKAETQAREAKIEMSLEKIRSRTMGMQSSDELPEVANLLFLEVQALGIPAWSCGYCILTEDRRASTCIMSSEGTIQKPFLLPHTEEDSFREWDDFVRSDNTFFTQELGGQEIDSHYSYMKSLPQLKPIFQELVDAGLSLPTYQINHLGKFSNGFLLFITYEEVKGSHDLFKRFTFVFDQTYTRFLDLKKAEAQAIKAENDLIEIKAARKKAEEALTELKATQKQLIQSEKMASLGELTAGIAHEIQNPLNFVNNFSELSVELIEEMNEELDKGDTEEAKAIGLDLKDNLSKINHHGKRAEGIVKGMLEHSKTSSGVKEPTDINALCDEYLRLAYHGLRAKDKSFNSKFETDFDISIGKVNVVPQDIGRVILNLITNAFYVVNESTAQKEEGYQPQVVVSTKRVSENVIIKVEDNGNGIPENIKEKIFQPFFTTKPTGKGTGLGLSLSYDIVKAHGGELKLETKEGKGSTFIVQLTNNKQSV